jgi:protein-S-isoprenylcysteine O-methyltransferase Ste14
VIQPLPSTNSGAALAFGIAVGAFAVVAVGASAVTGVRSARSRVPHVGLDRWSLPFVIVCGTAGFGGAFLIADHVGSTTIAAGTPALRWAVFGLGIAVILVGAAVRLLAILTLGRWFTYDVRVTEGQVVVDTGPYRWVRHPSYTGIVLVLLGIGLALGNWLALLVIAVLPTIGLVRRIDVEEAALLGAIGEPYARYAAGKRRLFPGIW